MILLHIGISHYGPHPMVPQPREPQPMGSKLRKPKTMRPLPSELQLTIFPTLGIWV